MLEAVNRVPKLIKFDLKRRVACVVVPMIAARFLSSFLYERFWVAPKL